MNNSDVQDILVKTLILMCKRMKHAAILMQRGITCPIFSVSYISLKVPISYVLYLYEIILVILACDTSFPFKENIIYGIS